MAQINFDPSQFAFQETPEALPPGWYPAAMIESDLVPTSKGDGFRLKCTYQIIDGPGKGRKIPAGYNVENPNPEAVRISMEELKTAQACMGQFSKISDSTQLHNLPLQIRLAKQKDSDYNEVKGYKTIDGKDAKDATQGSALPPMGHQAQPPQGFAAPPIAPSYGAPAPPYAAPVDPTAGWQRQNGHRLNPATNAWELDTPAAPPPPPPVAAAPPAPPAWAPPAPPAAPAAPPAYAAPAAPTPAPPAWAPQAGPAAPAWTPQ